MAINDTEVPWTTARCNRLLRPIVSKLTILRKKARSQDPQHNNVLESSSISRPSRDITRAGTTITELQATLQDGREGKHDPDWVPVAARRGVKRKYSARAPPSSPVSRSELGERKVNKPALQPGEIVVPTPYITRTFLPTHDRITSPHTGSTDYRGSFQLHGQALEHCKPRGRKPNALHPKASMRNSLRSASPARKALFDSLFDAFRTLLSGTTVHVPPRKYGARSLSSCCLQQVPAYIELERYWKAVEDEDDKTDPTTNVYAYLEEKYGAGSESGWKSLREIVRGHGITLFQQAILEGVIPEEMIQALVQQCIRDQAYGEAEGLVSTVITTQEPLGRPDHGEDELFGPKTSSALSLLKSFVDSTFRHGFLYRQLGLMLSRGQIRVEWLSTKDMLPVWSLVIRSLSESDSQYADAVKLMEVTMLAGLGLKTISTLPAGYASPNATDTATDAEEKDTRSQSTETSCRTDSEAEDSNANRSIRKRTRRPGSNAFDNTFSSLAIIMSTIALLTRHQVNSDDVAQSSISSVHYWTLSVVSECIVREGTNISATAPASFAVNKRIILFLTCIILLQGAGCTLRQGLVSSNVDDCIFWIDQLNHPKATKGSTTLSGNLPAFVCAIARCCGRALQDDGFSQFQRLAQGLVQLGTNSTNTSVFIKQLALDSALAFADASKSTEHIAFAGEIENAIRDVHLPRQLTARTPRPKESRGHGYRWEEGICEWIAATPAVVLKQMKPSSPKPEPSVAQVAGESPEHKDMPPPIVQSSPAEVTPLKPSLSSLLMGHDTPESAIRTQALAVRMKHSKKRRGEHEHSTLRNVKKLCGSYTRTHLADVTNTFHATSDSEAPEFKKVDGHRRPCRKRKPFFAWSTSLRSRLDSDEDELSIGEKSCGTLNSAARRPHRQGNMHAPGKGVTVARRSGQVRSLSVGDLGSSDDELSFV